MVTKEQLKSLNSRKEELYRCLDISKKKEDANNLEETTQSENFWKDTKKAQAVLKQLNSLKIWLKAYKTVANNIDELEVLIELKAEETELESQLKKTVTAIEDLEFKNMLSAKEDNLSAIMTRNTSVLV